jgi:hypothetical protein
MKKAGTMLLFVLMLTALLSGCNSNSTINTEEIDKINIKIVNHSEQPDGVTFSLQLINGSSHVILQNNVFLSFPFKVENGKGQVGNNFKIKAIKNKLNIKPKEEVLLIVFAPKKEYEHNENLDVNHPYIEIEGYFDKLSSNNQFSKSGFDSY